MFSKLLVLAAIGLASANSNKADTCTAKLMSMTGTTMSNKEKCEIITTFSSCVLSIDTAKGDLPVSTAVLATHKNLEDQLKCKVADAVARPELRTARGDLEISVNDDVKFVRHRRDVISISDMRDQLDKLTGSVAKQMTDQELKNKASLEALVSAATTAIADTAASAEKVNTALQKSLIAAVDKVQSDFVAAKTDLNNKLAVNCKAGTYYNSGAKACKTLTTCSNGKTYYTAIGSGTQDAVCSPVSSCKTGATFQVVGPTLFSNRVCQFVTKCASGCNEASKPTLTADRQCYCVEKFVMPAQSAGAALNSCLAVRKYFEDRNRQAIDGMYFIKFGGSGSTRKTECDNTRDGGGWTLIGRAIGNDRDCWHGDAACREDKMHITSKTAKISTVNFNKINYKVIRVEGSLNTYNAGVSNRFWYYKGKGMGGGGCTAGWWKTASGGCVVSYQSLDWQYKRTGSAHGNHRFVGDWPRGGSNHIVHINGNRWYYHMPHAANQHSPSCSGNEWGCNMRIWIRE